MDPEEYFQVVGDDGRRGHVFKLFKKGADWMLADSSLRIGCARSGTGWMMMWLRWGH